MNFFLRDVWKQSKMVFAFFVMFILGTLFCTVSKIEVTPFFLWAHYSDQQTPTGKFERVYIKVNGEILDLQKLSRPTREMIQLPTEYFVKLERNGYDSGTRQLIRGKLADTFSAESAEKLEHTLCNSNNEKYAYLYWLTQYIEGLHIDGLYKKGVYDRVQTIEVGTCELIFQKDRSVVRENSVTIAELSRP